jgi:hypothetical protein
MRDLILMCMAAGVMLAAALGAEAGAAPAERWTAGRAWEWYRAQPWIVGTNYVPSTAANTTEFWQAESFAPPTIGRELGWAADLGFNACRVFVQYAVWKADPTGLKARLGRFLGIAEGHGIRTVVGLFDDCTFGDPPQTEPYLGRQREPIPGMIAPSWTPSPGLKEVEDRAAWPSLEAYLKDLVGTFARDGRVLMWDLYNEPGNSGMGNRSLPLVEAAFGWARAAAPTQPVTSGVWGGTAEITARLLELSDVVTFHRYGDTASVRGAIADLKATGRPLVCTEWMARLLGSRWETDLPVFQAEDVGCLNWGLVNGRTQAQFPWGSPRGAPEPKVWFHDLLHRDGTPYDGAEVAAIREVTGHLTPTLARVECHGWHCWRLSNGLVDVTVAPQLGGRIIQIALGGHGFLWVNPDLQGRAPPPTRLGPKGEWLNWGGEKIWPAPQGWGKGDQWPGPPDPVLDGGPYAFEVLRQDAEEVAVRLTSEKDARSGIQFSRVIRLRRGSAAVSVEATMANICDRPRRWSIWAIAQMDGRRPGGGWSPDLWAYCPANPASRFPGGYKVLFGPADNPSWRPVPAVGLVAVQFQYRVGKIGLDSPGGWVAAVDRSSGGALVHTPTGARSSSGPRGWAASPRGARRT